MKVVAFNRTEQGSGASRRLRTEGFTPGIIYGGEAAPLAIKLDHNALFHALKKEIFHSSILDFEIDGKTEKVLLRDFQMHAYKQIVLHVDFQRVDPNKEIHTRVPLHFVNAEISPAVKLGSGIVSHVMNEIEVSCLPSKLPEFITVDLSNLELDHALHISAIVMPEGVRPINHSDDQVIASATVPRGVVSAEADASTETTPAASDKK